MKNTPETEKVYPINKPPGLLQKQPPAFNTGKGTFYRAPINKHRRRSVSPRRLCCRCCSWTIIAVLCLLFLAGLGGLISYFVFKPQLPDFSVADLKILNLNFTTSKSGDTHLSSGIRLRLEARNPNTHLDFAFQQSSISVSYLDSLTDDTVPLGNGVFPAFYAGKKNITAIKLDMKTRDALISGSSTARNLRALFAKKKLHVRVGLTTRLRVVIKNWKSGDFKTTVECPRVSAFRQADHLECKVRFFEVSWFPFK